MTYFKILKGVLLMACCHILYSQSPVLKKAIIPTYPPLYRLAKISGTIELDVAVDRNGYVISTRVTKHINDKILGDSKFVDDVFKKWIFEPNKPGVMSASIILKIMPVGAKPDELVSEFELPSIITIKTESPQPEQDPIKTR